MGALKWFSSWSFDPLSSAITVIVVPIIVYIGLTIRKSAVAAARYLVEGILYIISPILNKTAAASFSLRRYSRLQLAQSNRYLHIPSITDISVDLDTIFVPLVLEGTVGQTSYDHHSIFNAGNRIRIIGDPGSGKSSIVKRMFRDACNFALVVPRRARLPILIELRNVNFPKLKEEDLGQWMFDYLRETVIRNRAYKLTECFDAYTQTTGLLVLLDGLDEVSTASYELAQAAIVGLSAELARMSDKNIIILTMRIQFHQQVKSEYSKDYPVVLTLKPFTPTDIYQFLRQWQFRRGKKMENVVRIYTELTDHPTLREMCANPLVLSMYVAQDQSTGRPITPESRTDFYARVTDELLIKRRAEQIGPHESQAVLRTQRQSILGRVAFDHLLNSEEPANVISWKYAVRVVEDVTGRSGEEAVEYLRHLRVKRE